MFLVEMDLWADGNLYHTLTEVFECADDALRFQSHVSGLTVGDQGWAGEAAYTFSLSLDGKSSMQQREVCKELVSSKVFDYPSFPQE